MAGLLSWWGWRRWRKREVESDPVAMDARRRGHQPAADTPVGSIAAAGVGLFLFVVIVMTAAALLSVQLDGDGQTASDLGGPPAGYEVPPPDHGGGERPVRAQAGVEGAAPAGHVSPGSAVPANVGKFSGRPQLQVDPTEDLLAFRLREDSLLQGQSEDVVLSIDEAIERLAGRASDTAAPLLRLRMLTESGYIEAEPRVPPHRAPAYRPGVHGSFAPAPNLGSGHLQRRGNDTLAGSASTESGAGTR